MNENEPFRLELLADDLERIEDSRNWLIDRTNNFVKNYRSDKANYPMEFEQATVLETLTNAAFWATLSLIDGCNNEFCQDSAEKMREKREWAKKHFAPHQLQEILTICINQALLVPFKSGCPGAYKGHWILHQELAEKQGSIFASVVDDSFRKRLNNGRFWEAINGLCPGLNGGVAYHCVNDVILNHFEDLDPAFAQKGLEIIERHNPELDAQFGYLTKKSIDKYILFVNQIYGQREKLGIDTDKIAMLVKPYALAIIDGRPAEEGYRQYSDLKKRLRDPAIQMSLKKDNVLNEVAEHLSNSDIYYAAKVVRELPEPKKALDFVVKHMSEYNIKEFLSETLK